MMLAALLASGATISGALLNRRRLGLKWEREVAARISIGPDGVVHGAGPIALGHGGRGVLIVHGFGDTPQSVRDLATLLHAHGWTVRAPLLRGHGRSLHDHVRVRAEDWLADARRALLELRESAQTVSIVGQSMGGALAILLAAESTPDALVLLAPVLRLSRRGTLIARFHLIVSAFVPYLYSRSDSSIRDPEARRRALGLGVTTPRLVRELGVIVRSAWNAAPSVAAPTLVIHSAQDPRIAVPDARAAFARLSASIATLKWAEHSGHVLTVDLDRDWIASEVIDWLGTHSGFHAGSSHA